MNTTALDNAIENGPQPEAPARPTDANGNFIYRVPEGNMEGLTARVAKMNKRAAKLGMDPLVLTTVGEEFETHKKRELDEETGLYHITEQTFRLVLVTLTGTCPRVNGWAMAATIQHEEGGNILRTVPGFETMLPLQYRTNGTICEHCETSRKRNNTYVLQSETDGWKQVGRNCLADFLRTENASGLAEWAELLAGLDEELGGYEDESFGGGHQREYFTALALLTQVACCVRADGWCSRTEAKNSYDKLATVDSALSCMNHKTFSKLSERDQIKLTPNDADGEKAKAAIEWAQELPTDVGNDYHWNIRVVSHKEHIGHREAGLAGSIISAYSRHMEQELAKKYERDNPSEWFGTVGKRETFTLTVTGFRDLQSDWGSSTLVSFRTPNGSRGKWFASNVSGFHIDGTYEVKASVKAHETYKDSKQTLLTRCTIYDAAAEAIQKANAKIIKAVLKKRYACKHERTNDYGNRVNWQYIEVPELAQYAAVNAYDPTTTGVWMEACCNDCYAAWTALAEEEALNNEVAAIAAGQVAYA